MLACESRQLLNSPALANGTCSLRAVTVAESLGSSSPATGFVRPPHCKQAGVRKADAKS